MRRQAINLWYWLARPGETGSLPHPLAATLGSRTAPGRALDLGCGTGLDTLCMAERGWDVVGVDFASRAIRRARQRASEAPPEVAARVRFEVADVTDLRSIAPTFDLILDRGCFHGLPEIGRPAYATEVTRLVSDEGRLLLFAFRPGVTRVRGTTYSELRSLFRSRLQVTEVDECNSGSLKVARWLPARRPVPAAWYTLRRP